MLDTRKKQAGVTHWNLISKPAVLQALFSHTGWYHQSQINTGAKQSRVEFLRQCRVCRSFLAAHNTRARSVVASLLFQAGKWGGDEMRICPRLWKTGDRWWCTVLGRHLLMSKSKQWWIPAAGTFASLQIAGVAGWNLYNQSPYKNNMQDMFWTGYF